MKILHLIFFLTISFGYDVKAYLLQPNKLPGYNKQYIKDMIYYIQSAEDYKGENKTKYDDYYDIMVYADKNHNNKTSMNNQENEKKQINYFPSKNIERNNNEFGNNFFNSNNANSYKELIKQIEHKENKAYTESTKDAKMNNNTTNDSHHEASVKNNKYENNAMKHKINNKDNQTKYQPDSYMQNRYTYDANITADDKLFKCNILNQIDMSKIQVTNLKNRYESILNSVAANINRYNNKSLRYNENKSNKMNSKFSEATQNNEFKNIYNNIKHNHNFKNNKEHSNFKFGSNGCDEFNSYNDSKYEQTTYGHNGNNNIKNSRLSKYVEAKNGFRHAQYRHMTNEKKNENIVDTPFKRDEQNKEVETESEFTKPAYASNEHKSNKHYEASFNTESKHISKPLEDNCNNNEKDIKTSCPKAVEVNNMTYFDVGDKDMTNSPKAKLHKKFRKHYKHYKSDKTNHKSNFNQNDAKQKNKSHNIFKSYNGQDDKNKKFSTIIKNEPEIYYHAAKKIRN